MHAYCERTNQDGPVILMLELNGEPLHVIDGVSDQLMISVYQLQ